MCDLAGGMQDYPEFLQLFLNPLLSQLTSTAPQFEDSDLHKLRHAVLEVLAKLPANDSLKPSLPQLMQVSALTATSELEPLPLCTYAMYSFCCTTCIR